MLREQIAFQPPARTDKQTASRHGVGHYAGLHPEDTPHTTGQRARRQPVPLPDDDDALYDTRLPSSARRYHTDGHIVMRVTHHQQPRIARASLTQTPTTRPPVRVAAPARRTHWLVRVGLVSVVAVVALTVGGMLFLLVGQWWQTYQDDQHYGRPRTMQIDQVVGHDDSPAHPSHFIALNLHGHTQVIEEPGGDASKARVYLGPVLDPSRELDPVTVSFQDVNGDGKPDMILTIDSFRIAFINDNGAFRPTKPDDHVSM